MTLLEFGKVFAKPLWRWYAIGTLFLALTNLVTLWIPQLAKDIINSLGSGQDMGNVALGIVALGIGQIICRSLSRILIFWPGRRIEETSKSYLFAKTMALPDVFFNKFGMGDLISRLSNDLGQVRVFFAFATLQLLNLIFMLVFTISMMFSIHPTLTTICLIPILVMIGLTRFIMPTLAKFSRESQEAVGRLTNRVTESFTNIHILKANGAERAFQSRAEVENNAVFESNMKVITFRTLFFPLLTSLTGISQLIVIGYGGFQIIEAKLTVGDILAFNIYLGYLAFPLTSIGIVLSIYQRSKTALTRISPIVASKSENADVPDMTPSIDQTKPLLQIKDLSFSFPSEANAEAALQNIDLKLEKGSMIGICGPVGSGKSTLFNLIVRLYTPPDASVFLEGVDINQLKTQTIRRKIAYGLQEIHMFSDTITGNLEFGLPEKPSQQELEQACKKAQIYDEIMRFPAGWQTQIGEKGVRLSGGQKQRLALARIFLRKPDIYIFDDVFSAVDNQTEAKLVDYLKSTNATILVASHRSSILNVCDEVVYLNKGKICDRGDYTQLLARCPELREDQHESN